MCDGGPAYSGALNSDCDFTMLQVLSLLDAIQCRSRLGHPELVLRVSENTNIRQADGVGHGSHVDLVLRTEEAGGGWTSRRGQTGEVGFLIRNHRIGGGRLASSSVVEAFRRTSVGAGGAKKVSVAGEGDIGIYEKLVFFFGERRIVVVDSEPTKDAIDVGVVQRVEPSQNGGVERECGT